MLDLYNIIYQLSYIETDTLDLHFKSALGNRNYQLDCISTYVCLVPSSKNVTLLKVLPLLIFHSLERGAWTDTEFSSFDSLHNFLSHLALG